MTDREKYECEVITKFRHIFSGRRPSAISDHDLGNEYEAARRFYNALKWFRHEAEAAQQLSTLRGGQIGEMLDALSDYTPGMTSWEEAISDARQGYIGSGIK